LSYLKDNSITCGWDASWALNAAGGIKVNSLNILLMLDQLNVPLELLIRPKAMNFVSKNQTAMVNLMQLDEKHYFEKFRLIEPFIWKFSKGRILRIAKEDLGDGFHSTFKKIFLHELPDFKSDFSLQFSSLSQDLINLQSYRGANIPSIKSSNNFHFSGDVIAPLVKNSTHFVRLHDAIPEIFPEFSSYRHQRIHSRLLSVHARNSTFLAVSNTAVDQAERALKTTLKKRVVVNDPISFQELKEETECYDKLSRYTNYRSDPLIQRTAEEWKDKKVIVQIGPLEPKKNHEIVLDALEQCGNDILYVCITSSGWGSRRSEKRLSELVASKKAMAFYDLPYRGFANILSLADAVVAPSIIEGYDRPPLEGLTFGAEIYASDISAHREMLPVNLVSMFTNLNELIELISATRKLSRHERDARVKVHKIALDHLSERSISHKLKAIFELD